MPARKRADVIKEKLDEARKAIEEEARRRLFKVDYEEVASGPFYRPEWVNEVQIVATASTPLHDAVPVSGGAA